MESRVIESGRTTAKRRRSKYARYLRAMTAAFDQNGADGKLRAIIGTEGKRPATLRRLRVGIRDHAKKHLGPGVRLNLRTCRVNGLCFRWTTAR